MGPLDLNEVNKISPILLDKDLDYRESAEGWGYGHGQTKNGRWHGFGRDVYTSHNHSRNN